MHRGDKNFRHYLILQRKFKTLKNLSGFEMILHVVLTIKSKSCLHDGPFHLSDIPGQRGNEALLPRQSDVATFLLRTTFRNIGSRFSALPFLKLVHRNFDFKGSSCSGGHAEDHVKKLSKLSQWRGT